MNTYLSLFEIAKGNENFAHSFDKPSKNIFFTRNSPHNSKKISLENHEVKNKEDIFLTLKIFSDKQYDYDQNIYIAEGNVKAIINGGTLRSDLLSYNNLTGDITAEGNIRFTKGEQYFRGKEFRYNLLKKEGIIKNVYGRVDIKNVLEDLKIDSYAKEILFETGSKNKLNNDNEKNTFPYHDGIEFSFGNMKLPKNKITRSNKSIGEINYWRFKSDLIIIKENGWKSNRINFTNDPFDPHQISFEGKDVIAEENDYGGLTITSSKTNLILGKRSKFFLGKRIFGGRKKRKSRFELLFDSKDRDGLILTRRSHPKYINNNVKVDIKPQFMINRAFSGKTDRYNDNKNITLLDLFGLNVKLNANYGDWDFDSFNDLSTLNTSRFAKGMRHSSFLRKYIKMPIIDDSKLNIFATYRSRAWNGTIGETEIKSAFGGFVDKTQLFESGKIKNNLSLRFGTAKYEAEKLSSNKIISLWRSSIFASLDSEYEIWKMKRKSINKNHNTTLSPVLINPELVLKSNINSAYFHYEDGSDQGFIKISLGPEIRLGKLERNLFDYTKFSVMPGIKIKTGDSPFKFDNAIDLKTLNISLLQQIYGPLMLDLSSIFNIDNNSNEYGKYYDTKLGILWHKRAYEFGLYYHPDHEAGGLYFRINGFNFDDSVRATF